MLWYCPLQVGFGVVAFDDEMVMDTVHGLPVSVGGDFKDAVASAAPAVAGRGSCSPRLP